MYVCAYVFGWFWPFHSDETIYQAADFFIGMMLFLYMYANKYNIYTRFGMIMQYFILKITRPPIGVENFIRGDYQ